LLERVKAKSTHGQLNRPECKPTALSSEVIIVTRAHTSSVFFSQQTCGFEYTSKLQRMFQDIGVSKDLNERFRTHLSNTTPLDIDFSIQVLCSGSWPFQQSITFRLPVEV